MLELGLMVMLAAGPAAPPPTVVPPMFYSEIVGKAQQIVTGTVVKSESRYERGKETIATYVTFANLVVLKGKVGKTITIRLEGGKIGADVLTVPLMPQFAVGKRYLIYVDGLDGKKVSPIVGFHQGCFQVVIRNGREVLLNTGGEELIGIKNDRFVFAAKPGPKIPNQAPPVVQENIKWRPALPNVDAIEAAQRAKEITEAEAAQNATRVPVVGAGGGNVQGPASEGRPAAKPIPDRKDAMPIMVLPQNDTGTRLSVKSLMSLSTTGGR